MNDLLDDMFDTEGVSVVRPTIIDIWKTISVELEDMWVITNIEWDKKYENFFDRDVVKGISDFNLAVSTQIQFRDRFRFLFPVLTIFPLDEFQRVLGINQCQNQIPDYPRLSHSHPFGYFG